MRVSVAFEFGSVAEAVHFMGQHIEGDVTAAVVVSDKPGTTAKPTMPAGPIVTSPAIEAVKRKAGRPRKPKDNVTPEPAPAQAATSVSSPEPASVVAPVPVAPAQAITPTSEKVAPAAAVPTNEQLVASMQAILDSRGMEAVMATLQRHGVAKASLLRDEDKAAFVTYCADVVSGKINPTTGH